MAGIKKEMDVLIHKLNSDADYRRSWVDNIAVCAQDEGVSHDVSNRAAERFLDVLTRDQDGPDDGRGFFVADVDAKLFGRG